MSLAYSRKHRRQMLSEYLRIRPRVVLHTRLQRQAGTAHGRRGRQRSSLEIATTRDAAVVQFASVAIAAIGSGATKMKGEDGGDDGGTVAEPQTRNTDNRRRVACIAPPPPSCSLRFVVCQFAAMLGRSSVIVLRSAHPRSSADARLVVCTYQARESGPNLRGCAFQVAWTPMLIDAC